MTKFLLLYFRRPVETRGELVFENGESEKIIEVPIIDDEVYEKDETFDLILTNVSGVVRRDGGGGGGGRAGKREKKQGEEGKRDKRAGETRGEEGNKAGQ